MTTGYAEKTVKQNTDEIKWMKIILSHYFSPGGRAGGFHLLRY
jgi:hypothetical protein